MSLTILVAVFELESVGAVEFVESVGAKMAKLATQSRPATHFRRHHFVALHKA